MSTPFLSFNPGDLIEDSHVEQFIEPIQNLEAGKPWYAEAAGSANAFEVTLDPAPAAYTAGMIVHFKANNNVTSAATLNVNGLGTKSLQKEGNTSLISGDIVNGQMVSVIYDGTNFQLLSPALNPTITAAGPTENVLVYAETRAEQPTSTLTALSLPSFTFDSGKTYLLEMTLASNTAAATARITFNDGSTDYIYPTASTYIKARALYHSPSKMLKMLPTLSGLHTISVTASYAGSIEVKIYEVHDNLVYADSSPTETGATVTAFSLENFTAVSGHTYLLTMTAYGMSTSYQAAGCYVDDGSTILGVPHPDPTSNVVKGPYYLGKTEVSKILSGLSGVCQVVTRRAYAGAVTVQIRDIT